MSLKGSPKTQGTQSSITQDFKPRDYFSKLCLHFGIGSHQHTFCQCKIRLSINIDTHYVWLGFLIKMPIYPSQCKCIYQNTRRGNITSTTRKCILKATRVLQNIGSRYYRGINFECIYQRSELLAAYYFGNKRHAQKVNPI